MICFYYQTCHLRKRAWCIWCLRLPWSRDQGSCQLPGVEGSFLYSAAMYHPWNILGSWCNRFEHALIFFLVFVVSALLLSMQLMRTPWDICATSWQLYIIFIFFSHLLGLRRNDVHIWHTLSSSFNRVDTSVSRLSIPHGIMSPVTIAVGLVLVLRYWHLYCCTVLKITLFCLHCCINF